MSSIRTSHNQNLATYEVRYSPRDNGEEDVQSRLEKLVEQLRKAKLDLKDYKKLIETYRSEISGMQRTLETGNNENLRALVPNIQAGMDYYNQEINIQRTENVSL